MRLMPFSDELAFSSSVSKQSFREDSTALRIDDSLTPRNRSRRAVGVHIDETWRSMPLVQLEMLSRIELLVSANVDLLSIIAWRTRNSTGLGDHANDETDYVHRFGSAELPLASSFPS
jgi:hypothetical protein